MSLFAFVGSIFKPAAELIDNLHVSAEELGILRNELAQIEARVSIKLMELQSTVIDANSKVAIAEQQHGNILSKSWRPLTSLGLLAILIGMAYGLVPFNELLAQIAGGFLGVYGIGRSFEKRGEK